MSTKKQHNLTLPKVAPIWTDAERVQFVALSRAVSIDQGLDTRKGRFDFNLTFPVAMEQVPEHRRRTPFTSSERANYIAAVISKDARPSFERGFAPSEKKNEPDLSWAYTPVVFGEQSPPVALNTTERASAKGSLLHIDDAKRCEIVNCMRTLIEKNGMTYDQFNFTNVFESAVSICLPGTTVNVSTVNSMRSILRMAVARGPAIGSVDGWRANPKQKGRVHWRLDERELVKIEMAKILRADGKVACPAVAMAFTPIFITAQINAGLEKIGRTRAVLQTLEVRALAKEVTEIMQSKMTLGKASPAPSTELVADTLAQELADQVARATRAEDKLRALEIERKAAENRADFSIHGRI